MSVKRAVLPKKLSRFTTKHMGCTNKTSTKKHVTQINTTDVLVTSYGLEKKKSKNTKHKDKMKPWPTEATIDAPVV